MIQNSTPEEAHYSVRALDYALMCVGHHDYEVNISFRNFQNVIFRKNENLNINLF